MERPSRLVVLCRSGGEVVAYPYDYDSGRCGKQSISLRHTSGLKLGGGGAKEAE
jgi:hypothetical protein